MNNIFIPSAHSNSRFVPIAWVIGLVVLELIVSAGIGLVVELLGIPPQSWIGIVGAMSGAMIYAMLAERRSPGALTRSIRWQLAGFATVAVTGIGFAAISVERPDEMPFNSPIVVAFTLFAIVITLLVHVSGFNQGIKIASAGKTKP